MSRDDGELPPLVGSRLDALGERLAGPERVLACLDFDGTLAPIVDDPDDAAIPERTRRVLSDLAVLDDIDLAVVTGRSLADVRDRVDAAGLAIAGNHGLEVHANGETAVHPAARDARASIREVCETVHGDLDADGIVVEDKGLTATVHYRQASVDGTATVGDRVESVVGSAVVAVDGDLRVSTGKQVVEVRPPVDWDKGDAVELLADTSRGDPLTLYVGDDTTDEAAFRALSPGDVGVHVGRDPETAADVRVTDPGGVEAFLRWLRWCRR